MPVSLQKMYAFMSPLSMPACQSRILFPRWHCRSMRRFTPSTRVENACGSGSAAVFQAANMIESGRARRVLAIGVEKMTHLSSGDVGRCLSRCFYAEEGDAGLTFRAFSVSLPVNISAIWRPVRRIGKNCRQKPCQWRGQSVGPYTKDFGYDFVVPKATKTRSSPVH